MIVNFIVENFGSIKEKQTLSFEADKSSHLEDQYVIKTNDGTRLLKLALIYGANASGKTTVLDALHFLRTLVMEPKEKKTDELEFEPFLFDLHTPKCNSKLSLEFFQNSTRYLYHVEFNKKAIFTEELFFFNPNKASVYRRVSDIEKQFTEITFGNKIKKDKTFQKTLEANTLWNNTVLGGFLKTNIELKELKDVTDWFSKYLKPLIYKKTNLQHYVTSRIDKKEINKADIVNILRNADFNISNINIQEKEENIPDGLLDFLEKQSDLPKDGLNKIKGKGKITSLKLEIEHTVQNNQYTLPFDRESQGTQRYYGFAGLLCMLIKGAAAFPIDELEDSLHPDLYIHFILSFLINSNRSQIIATTHNRELLDNKDLFRNDAIWFTDKAEDAGTILYSLSDFDSSVIRDTSNIYRAYKSGKLMGKPNLGDYFINL